MTGTIDFETIPEAEWRSYSRGDDTDLAKKADCPFVYRFMDLTLAQFLERLFNPRSNIFRPSQVNGVHFQAEDWVPGELRVRVDMPEFEVWVSNMRIPDDDYLITHFGNQACQELEPHIRANRIGFHFGTYSNFSQVEEHVEFMPTLELIDIAMEKPERLLFSDMLGDRHPPRVLKPGVCVRSAFAEPDGLFVEDTDIITWSHTKIEIASQQTLRLVERYPHVRVIRDMGDFSVDNRACEVAAVIPRTQEQEEEVVRAILKIRPFRRNEPFPEHGLAGYADYVPQWAYPKTSNQL